MGVSISLARSKSDTRSCLRIKVSVCNAPFFVYPGLSIETSLWDNHKKQIQCKNLETSMVNARLQEVITGIELLLNQFKYQNDGKTYLELKHQILERFAPKFTDYSEQSKSPIVRTFFSGMISDMANGKKLKDGRGQLSASTISSYSQSFNYFCEFETAENMKYRFSTFKTREVGSFRVFLLNKGLSSSTIEKVVKHLRAVFNYAVKLGQIEQLHVKLMDFRITNTTTKKAQTYLRENELQEFAQLECRNKKMELARDLFVVGCHTGMRASDLVRLNSFEVDKNRIHVIQQKTGGGAIVPMKDEVMAIYKKYNYHFPSIAYNTYYRYVKELGKALPSLCELTIVEDHKGKATKKVPRIELFATHCSRRTFVTLELLKDAPVDNIMRVAGFKSIKCFLVYVRASSDELAYKAARFWGLK